MARCPAHPDRNPSLAIQEVDGKPLFHCHAGCTQGAVITALRGLSLWKAASGRQRNQGNTGPRGRLVATYNYADERGELLYQVLRYEPGRNGKPKDFSQRYPDGRGEWIYRKHQRQVLYRLPEVLEAPIVFLVEGEKDVETLRDAGFVATTNAGGADAQWLDSYTENLRGREVILIPDADSPGRRRARDIARALLGHAARLIVWETDGAKDITEWFQKGHSERELIDAITPEEVSQ